MNTFFRVSIKQVAALGPTHRHSSVCSLCVVVVVEVCVCVHVSSHASVSVKNHWDFGSLIWDWDRHHWIFYLLHTSCSPMSHKAPCLWTKLVRVKAPQRRETEYLPRVFVCVCVSVFVCVCLCEHTVLSPASLQCNGFIYEVAPAVTGRR